MWEFRAFEQFIGGVVVACKQDANSWNVTLVAYEVNEDTSKWWNLFYFMKSKTRMQNIPIKDEKARDWKIERPRKPFEISVPSKTSINGSFPSQELCGS
ncbi:hypothetical protein CDAR_255441 [Caerostris darwini]|uniref:Uncharacterized protein n=1 Tax=Caerostris darwini TaxID=1538125 RepID=A0AAV4ULD5_9ARAC|nr:hypothetical protein CDAR_255441 [Caerostris darwini]